MPRIPIYGINLYLFSMDSEAAKMSNMMTQTKNTIHRNLPAKKLLNIVIDRETLT